MENIIHTDNEKKDINLEVNELNQEASENVGGGSMIEINMVETKWKCSNCGTINLAYTNICKKCGKH